MKSWACALVSWGVVRRTDGGHVYATIQAYPRLN